jgi:hypothetical protein
VGDRCFGRWACGGLAERAAFREYKVTAATTEIAVPTTAARRRSASPHFSRDVVDLEACFWALLSALQTLRRIRASADLFSGACIPNQR